MGHGRCAKPCNSRTWIETVWMSPANGRRTCPYWRHLLGDRSSGQILIPITSDNWKILKVRALSRIFLQKMLLKPLSNKKAGKMGPHCLSENPKKVRKVNRNLCDSSDSSDPPLGISIFHWKSVGFTISVAPNKPTNPQPDCPRPERCTNRSRVTVTYSARWFSDLPVIPEEKKRFLKKKM